MVTEEDFESWRSNGITEILFRMLHAKADEARTYWAGELTSHTVDANRLAILKAELCAKLEFLEDIIGIELEDLKGYEQREGEEAGAKRRSR